VIRTAATWLLAAALAAEGLDGLTLADGRVLVGTWDPGQRLLTLPGEAVAMTLDPRDIRRIDPLPFERREGRWRVPAWRWLERTAPERDPYALVAWRGGFTTRPLAARYRREDGDRARDGALAAARDRAAALGRGDDGDLVRVLAWSGRLMAALSDGSEAADGVACAVEHAGAATAALTGASRARVLRTVTATALELGAVGATWSEIVGEAKDLATVAAGRGTPLAATAAFAAILDERAGRAGRARIPVADAEAERWIRAVLGDEAPAAP
jgi:hypothetical protein